MLKCQLYFIILYSTYSGEVNQKNAEERGTLGPALSCVVKLNLTIVKL